MSSIEIWRPAGGLVGGALVFDQTGPRAGGFHVLEQRTRVLSATVARGRFEDLDGDGLAREWVDADDDNPNAADEDWVRLWQWDPDGTVEALTGAPMQVPMRFPPALRLPDLRRLVHVHIAEGLDDELVELDRSTQ